MTQRPGSEWYSNEALMQYLEGACDEATARQIEADAEQDPELLSRIERLDPWRERLADASEDLLNLAPESAMAGWLAGELASADRNRAVRERITSAASRLLTRPVPGLAYLAAGLIVGALATHLLFPPEIELPDDRVPRWVTAAIDHTNLYTLETLRPNPVPLEDRIEKLRDAGSRVELDLAALAPAMTGYQFEQVWVMEYEGQPVIQMLFLHQGTTPVSVFVLYTGADEQDGREGVRRGRVDELSVTKWSRPAYEFLAVGRVTQDQLDELTDAVIAALDARLGIRNHE